MRGFSVAARKRASGRDDKVLWGQLKNDAEELAVQAHAF
jgi:hypothetical protein